MIAVPGGGGGGCWLPGAAVTSPGAGARLRLRLRAAGSASLALQVRVTHTVTRARPSRSLAPPPRRRRRAGQTHRRARTEVAGNVHVGHPGREGAAGEGAGRDPESSADRRECDFAAWGVSLAPPPLQAGEPSRGHPHPRLTDVPATQMSRGVRGQGVPSLLLQPVKPGTAAPSPRAEAVFAARSDAPRPKGREIRGEPGDLRPRGAEGCTAPAPTGLFREDASPACPREVLGSWMRKSLLSPAPRPRAF
ncbi:uncharacterized protein [Gorilla gorilla gorilla]|uniref:uncharacterized protein n=1 Tax=Gorilla gorilla gorilla TaxID=9595 RepID=UPI0024456571|nr:uncharacterized protein LOC115936009 [Gorilla gorilla gorilla]